MGIIFFSSNLFTPSWVFGEFGCKFSLTIDVLCTVVSLVLTSLKKKWIYALVVLSDRERKERILCYTPMNYDTGYLPNEFSLRNIHSFPCFLIT